MKTPTLSRISGWLAISLAALYSSLALFLPVFMGRANVELMFHTDFVITYWSIVFSLAFPYIFERLEQAEKDLGRLDAKPYSGLAVFRTAAEFIDALIEKTVGAETVCTLNFSPPAGVSAELDRYFGEVNKYLISNGTNLLSFRSIASIESELKARSVIDRARQFEKHAKLSLACFTTRHFERLMCYHVVFKNGHGHVFIYPPVALTGIMDAFMISSDDVATLMKTQFDIAWEHSASVLLGGVSQAQGLEFLAGMYPAIGAYSAFVSLAQTAS
jgi:hypothetical protein